MLAFKQMNKRAVFAQHEINLRTLFWFFQDRPCHIVVERAYQKDNV